MSTKREALTQLLCESGSIGERFDNPRPLASGSVGGFSITLEAVDRLSGEQVVIKILNPYEAGAYRTACFEREGTILQAMRGRENFLQLIHGPDQHYLTIASGPVSVPFPLNYIALEHAKTDFAALLLGKSPPRLGRRLKIVRDLARALERLHRGGYCHRDLKPDNVFLFGGGVVKLGDFGTCRSLDGTDPSLIATYAGPVGDLRYCAPEMVFGRWDERTLYCGADWFAVGAILFEACVGYGIYEVLGLTRELERIIEHVCRVPLGVRLAAYDDLMADVSGRFPVPSIHDFAGSPTLAEWTPGILVRLDNLIHSMCNFDHKKRLVGLDRVLPKLDLLRSHLAFEEHSRQGWQRHAFLRRAVRRLL